MKPMLPSSPKDVSGAGSNFERPKLQRPSVLQRAKSYPFHQGSPKISPQASSPRSPQVGPLRSAVATPNEDSSSDDVEVKGPKEIEYGEPLRRFRRSKPTRTELTFNFKHDGARDGNTGVSGGTRQSRMERFSPILEEDPTRRSPKFEGSVTSPLTGIETASTESNKTVKWSSMPQTPGTHQVSTPSYPFPPMTIDSGTPTSGVAPALHRPFTALSPTTAPSQSHPVKNQTTRDRLATDSNPLNSRKGFSLLGNSEAESLDLYNITLKLQSEPGLDRWWTNVSQIMRDSFGASRATLAVPSDSTDVENVPWAQMATFNAAIDDPLSSGPTRDLQSTQSGVSDSNGHEEVTSEASPKLGENAAQLGGVNWMDAPAAQSRPKLESRHSFSGFPQRLESTVPEVRKSSIANPQRPVPSRANSNVSFLRGGVPQVQETFQGTKLSSQSLQQHLATEAEKSSQSIDTFDMHERVSRARMLPVLQMLEMESDPLLNSAGAVRVLERGKLVHLTREYFDASQFIDHGMATRMEERYEQRMSWPVPESKGVNLSANPSEKSIRSASFMAGRPTKRPRSHTSGSSKSTSGSASAKDEVTEKSPYAPPYEDYEQVPVSPWSQSPAPSPAVQADPEVNPFFVDASVDEEAFSDNPPVHDYTSDRQIEVIGVDRASSIVHVPLVHPLVSKSKRQPRLNEVGGRKANKPSVSQKSSAVRGGHRQPSISSSDDDKKTPIAILSILSSTVPYPMPLSSSLKLLAPHLATSLYNARQHSNLEKQLTGISQRRHGRNPALELQNSQHPHGDLATAEIFSPPSTESVTSASEYSGTSLHSPRGSNVGTPGWDISGQGQYDEQSINKALSDIPPETSDNYFASKKRFISRRTPSGTLAASAHPSIPTPDVSMLLPKLDSLQSSLTRNDLQSLTIAEARFSTSTPPKSSLKARRPSPMLSDDHSSLNLVSAERSERSPQDSQELLSLKRETSPSRRNTEASSSPRRQAMLQASGHGSDRSQQQSKQLHTHGANFIATNPSLPAATSKLPSASPFDEARNIRKEDFVFHPPTSSMMRIMIDTGAVQEFIAEPKTGNICWANSRFQTYRNESAAEIRKKPWDTIHGDDHRQFRKLWTRALRTGDQISHQVRLRRFDGHYRWFHIRIVPIKDSYSSIKHWHGQAMDIHDQHVAEVNAAREKEKANSESKYRSLANSNPHIILAASVPEGLTFANTQWLSYSGQCFNDALGFGFLDHVHPDDIVKCQFPAFTDEYVAPADWSSRTLGPPSLSGRSLSSAEVSQKSASTDETMKGELQKPVGDETPGSTPVVVPSGLLRKLTTRGVIKASKDDQGRLSITTEMRLRSKLGQYRWHLVQGSLIESVNFGQGDAQWIIACADISDQKGIEEKLKEANTTLESETTRKMQFLSTMSHEIRTPLNGIIGNLQFLLNSHLDEYQSEWTYGADAAARGMHDLINDILDVSKAEAKMLTLYYDWFHIRSVIEDVFETLASKANEKRLELCYAVDKEVPSNVKGDGGRIRQILLNLVSNAIKFTQRGEIFVDCTVKKPPPGEAYPSTDPSDIFLLFSVQDTGSGFTEDDAKILFRPYSQIDNSSTRHNGGTGLGLLLCKQMVELHHGDISAFSTPGKGSTFTFSARFKLPTDADRPKIPYQNSSESTSSSSYVRGKKHVFGRSLVTSPGEISIKADTLESSGSSDPSVASSLRAARRSLRSSASSLDSRDTFAALDLTLPSKQGSMEGRSIPELISPLVGPELTHPPIYSILIVCPQEHTRRTTEAHIRQILPPSIPAQVATSEDIIASHNIISGEQPVVFTHIVLQLNDAVHVLAFIELILNSRSHSQTCMVIITDQAQQAAIMAGAPNFNYDQLVASQRLHFMLKPAKPPKFAKIFDPRQENALSKDHVRANAVEVVDIQKQAFKKFEEILGNRGIRVLAVEDNKLNMKVCNTSCKWLYILIIGRCYPTFFARCAAWR